MGSIEGATNLGFLPLRDLWWPPVLWDGMNIGDGGLWPTTAILREDITENAFLCPVAMHGPAVEESGGRTCD
jgi:hypothetical protein